MSSAVYFKFKASLKQYTIPFEGSSISVKDLRNAIKLQCGLKSSDFELQILDKQGKEYSKEEDLIPKFSDLVVRRLPKASDPPKKKIHNPEDMTRRDPYKNMNNLTKLNSLNNTTNLAKANIPDDEKIDIMANRGWEEYSEKNFQVKAKPYGVPPPSYVCNKCHQGGHWIHDCPGLRDKDGRLLDFKTVKRPTGIPQDFLLEVQPGTPGAYLTKEGKYMVPIKDAEAYALGKREKRPFSLEENPPYVEKEREIPSKFKCPLCTNLLDNPTIVPCCSTIYCFKCIMDNLFDPQVNGSRTCPQCKNQIETHKSLVDHPFLRQLIHFWQANMLPKEIVDSFISTADQFSIKKTELNEDSSKSPEMSFDSANNDIEIKDIEKTEEDKVFVNNRRVLKPKLSHQQAQDSLSNLNEAEKLKETSEIKSETKISEEDSKSMPDTTISVSTSNSSVITTSSVITSSDNNKITDKDKVIKEEDVDESIFGKVEDFNKDIVNNNFQYQEVKDQTILNALKDTMVKMETRNKRSETSLNNNTNSVRSNHSERGKYDRQSNNIYHSSKSSILPVVTLNSALAAAANLQVVNALLETTKANLMSQQTFAANQSVLSLSNPMLNNPLVIPSNITEINSGWPLISNTNTVANALPTLQNILNVSNLVSNPALNWLNNPQLNLTHNHINNHSNSHINNLVTSGVPLNPPNRILTKEEFYERQRQLRAQKLYGRYSRSPSGSQSPRRTLSRRRSNQRSYVRSRTPDHPKIIRRKYLDLRNKDVELRNYSKNRKFETGSSHHHRSSLHTKRESDHKRHNNEMRENTSYKYIDDQTSDNDLYKRVKYKHNSANTNMDHTILKDIDPKLMEDSIPIFLKYLTGGDKSKKSSSYQKESKISDKNLKEPLHSRSSSSKHKQNSDGQERIDVNNQINTIKYESQNQSEHDSFQSREPCGELTPAKKTKKHKIKKEVQESLDSDEDEPTKKKHKKHKKHKHKKSKKSKKHRKEIE